MADEHDEFLRQRRKRNVALALGLGFLVVLFFVMTMVRLGGQVFERMP
jgi:hypothetical protein